MCALTRRKVRASRAADRAAARREARARRAELRLLAAARAHAGTINRLTASRPADRTDQELPGVIKTLAALEAAALHLAAVVPLPSRRRRRRRRS